LIRRNKRILHRRLEIVAKGGGCGGCGGCGSAAWSLVAAPKSQMNEFWDENNYLK
jgi:Fe-S cluster biogenesis protein NfuA